MFGLVLIILGAYLVYIHNWFGFIALIVGMALFFANIGIQIDFKRNTYREFVGLLGYRFGKWKTLPKIDYVTVFIEHYAQRGSVASIDNTAKYSKVKVSLIVSRTERYDAGLFDSKEAALNTGLLIAKNLGTRLLDYTGPEPKWVDLG
jgi:hypothetical protein